MALTERLVALPVVATVARPETSLAVMASAVFACAAVMSIGAPVPDAAARPLNVACAMSASLALVTALASISPVAIVFFVASSPRASAVLWAAASAASRSARPAAVSLNLTNVSAPVCRRMPAVASSAARASSVASAG